MPHIPYLNMGLVPVYVGFAPDAASFKKELKRLGVPDYATIPYVKEDMGACCHRITSATGEITCIVAIKHFKTHDKLAHYAMLVHEATHVLQSCKTYMGEKEAGEEFEAYTMQYISGFLFDEFEKSLKKKKKAVKK